MHTFLKLCCLVPAISINISDSAAHLTAGGSYNLTCCVYGVENLHPTLTYHWIRNNVTLMQAGTNSSMLLFSPLRLSDAGEYVCHVIIASDHLANNVTRTSFPKDIVIQGK